MISRLVRPPAGPAGDVVDRRLFGQGIHHCIGAQLARLQARIAIGMLLERFTSMRTLGGEPRFRSNAVMRGLESLHVSATIGPTEPSAPQTQVRLKSGIRNGGCGKAT